MTAFGFSLMSAADSLYFHADSAIISFTPPFRCFREPLFQPMLIPRQPLRCFHC
jgi:hypothetical protein